MNLGERLAEYEGRGFDQRAATVNVLLEVALQALSSSFPNTFVCFGGATLVIFFGSVRQSADLDLLLTDRPVPKTQELLEVLSTPIAEAARLLRIAEAQVSALTSGGDHLKLLIRSGAERLFTVDVTRISAVIHSEIVDVPLGLERNVLVHAKIVSRDWLLLQKAEAFLTRRLLKVRDAFDIKILMDAGANLNQNLTAHLADGSASERLEDAGFIRDRINAVDAKRCAVELRPVLPVEVYRELAE